MDDVAGNGLNALGHEQARLIGARLAALPIRPATLVSSTLRRARETADDMAAAMKLTPLRDSLLQDELRFHSPAHVGRSVLVNAMKFAQSIPTYAKKANVLVPLAQTVHVNMIGYH
jgi:broad specificity phosphatase PhoE